MKNKTITLELRLPKGTLKTFTMEEAIEILERVENASTIKEMYQDGLVLMEYKHNAKLLPMIHNPVGILEWSRGGLHYIIINHCATSSFSLN
jgi:hypothetical protein